MKRAFAWAASGLLVAALCALALVFLRAWIVTRGPPLESWHRHHPPELTARDMDAADWSAWLAAEQAVFDDVRETIVEPLRAEQRVPANRYFADSPLHPARFADDWNRSYRLRPEGAARGAVVLLHGLTDAPYSLRTLGQHLHRRGFLVIGLRLPGHGTVPAGLARIGWRDWAAATRLAVREAARQVSPDAPLHVVGYSNGGALALMYALESLEDERLRRPAALVLISPMVGVNAYAGFAGVLGWPAAFPAFARAAWLDVTPEFNPFKYNSFPVNGARQSALLTRALRRRLERLGEAGELAKLPPVLTFQSMVDFTVSAEAVVRDLYARLPANGSELVLFDVNRSVEFGLLLTPQSESAFERLVSPAPQRYRTIVVRNRDRTTREVVAATREPGATTTSVRDLGLGFPAGVYSLSHVALPFPIDDPVYGLAPRVDEDFGLRLGALAVRGERGVLVVSQEALARLASNPFYPYLVERVDVAFDGAGCAD